MQGGVDFQPGSVIRYTAFGGTERTVKVDAIDVDISKGRAGFDGVVTDGPEAGTPVWGYDSQVTEVVSR